MTIHGNDDDLYEDATGSKNEDAEEFGPGKLGKGTDREIAKHAVGIWEAKNQLYSRRLAQWEVNEMRRSGFKNVHLQKREGITWITWAPPNLLGNP